MATNTYQFSSGPGWHAEYDVNTANWRVSQVRVVNNSASAVEVTVKKAGAVVFQTTAPAGQTTSWNISGVQLGWQPDYWNSLTETWDEAGIELADYEIGARWPA